MPGSLVWLALPGQTVVLGTGRDFGLVDHLDPQARSLLMGRVKRTGTKAELTVRSIAHRLGYRFRCDRGDLPGRPDIVFPGRRSVVFVHGCFWHRHEGCSKATMPKTNEDFWATKFAQNAARDRGALHELSRLGWQALVIWECETRRPEEVASRLKGFLGPPGPKARQGGR
jgi:DNA mismatch endonuclease (patch repair protein)